MDSIDAFNIAAMEIMNRCLDTFPVPAKIASDDIANVVEGFFAQPENSEEIFTHLVKLEEICQYTLIWLETEDFLIEKGSTMSHKSVTLSHKGLNAVNSIPSSISGKSTFRSTISKGLSNLTVNAASGVMVELFKSAG